MNSKERVRICLDHKEPDRVPIQIHYTPEFEELLFKKFNCRAYELEVAIGNDILCIPFGMVTGYYRKGAQYTTEWGITWKKFNYNTPNGKGYYTEIIDFPLSDDSRIDNFKPPETEKIDFKQAEEIIDKYGKDYYICGDLQCSLFEGYKYLRGLSKALEDLLINPDYVSKTLDRLIEYHLFIGIKLIEIGVDMIWLGDDLGGQKAMLMSPGSFRKVIKPKMAKMIKLLKERKNDLKIAFHTDGYVIPIIDDLIEVGVDVLNPIQPESMNPEEIKRRWGKDLSMWGSISVQNTLPFGTKEDVGNETLKRLKTICGGGGAILGPTHNVQIDTPLENFLFFLDIINKYGFYPINA